LRVSEALGDTADGVVLVGLILAVLVDGYTNRKGGSLCTALARDTVGTGGSAVAPCAVVGIARIARTLRSAFRVEASLLVKRHCMWSVRAAEDVAATPTMVSSSEECERLST